VITLDTSALVALLNRRDSHHAAAASAMAAEGGPLVVPAGILAEVAYLLESGQGTAALDTFLGDLETGAFSFDCAEEDLPRVRELVQRYSDLPLGFADSVVVSCAERNGGKVMSFDRRHFDVVAREGTIAVRPER